MLLRIECDAWGRGGYGLIAVDWTTDGMRRLAHSVDANGLFEEWIERLSNLEEGWQAKEA